MKVFVAALSALLAVASAVPIYDVLPIHKTGILGGYGDTMDVYKTMRYMGGDMLGLEGTYNPMYMLWAGMGGIHNVGMGMYGPYSPLYHHYGLLGMGNEWDLHRSTGMYPGMFDYGMYGGDMIGNLYTRETMGPMMMDKMFYKQGWNTVDKIMCYRRYGIERCNMMMMHMMRRMMPDMMTSRIMY